MTEPDVFEVVDAVKALLLQDDVLQDDADWKPVTYMPPDPSTTGKAGVLYVYPDNGEEYTPFEAGPAVRQDFRLVVDFAMDDQGESAGGVRLPAVTQAIRARVRVYADRVRTNQSSTEYDHLRVAGIDWQVINGQGFRGARLRLAGYRLWP